jgi:uncharacterized protein YoxC
MTIALAIAALGFAATATVLGIRIGGVRSDLTKARRDADNLASRLEAAAATNASLTTARDREVADLREKLKTLRDKIDAMPDSVAARRLVLADLDGMLQDEKTADNNRH